MRWTWLCVPIVLVWMNVGCGMIKKHVLPEKPDPEFYGPPEDDRRYNQPLSFPKDHLNQPLERPKPAKPGRNGPIGGGGAPNIGNRAMTGGR